MHFIGIDLAWGSLDPVKKPRQSGLAVLDANGRLEFVGAAVSDDEIYEALADYHKGDCVVAIDAPLRVTNASGQRLAETHLNSVFSAFDAGAHSANTKRFSDNPRGARIAEKLGIDIDPRSTSSRRAIEVYPHPATVALFRQGRIFKYKTGSVENRRSEFLRLMSAIENLASATVSLDVDHAEWKTLREKVTAASRPFQLDRAEDPVDAVVCAYIALYSTRAHRDVTIYGDYPDNGFILTPTLPEDLKPTPKVKGAPKAGTDRRADASKSTTAGEIENCRESLAAAQQALAKVKHFQGLPEHIAPADVQQVGILDDAIAILTAAQMKVDQIAAEISTQ